MNEERKSWILFVFLIVACGIVIFLKSARGDQFIFSSVFLLLLGLSGIAITLYAVSHTEYKYGRLTNAAAILALVGSLFCVLFSFYEIPFEKISQSNFLKAYYSLLAVAFLRATFGEAILRKKEEYIEG